MTSAKGSDTSPENAAERIQDSHGCFTNHIDRTNMSVCKGFAVVEMQSAFFSHQFHHYDDNFIIMMAPCTYSL